MYLYVCVAFSRPFCTSIMYTEIWEDQGQGKVKLHAEFPFYKTPEWDQNGRIIRKDAPRVKGVL